jgi:transposase
MRANPMPKPNQLKTPKPSAESVVKDIRRQTRACPSSEEKIRIILEGLRG